MSGGFKQRRYRNKWLYWKLKKLERQLSRIIHHNDFMAELEADRMERRRKVAEEGWKKGHVPRRRW